MFYYISGKLALLEAGFAVVDAGGVGYKLTISGTTYEALPHNRSVTDPPTVKLYTHLAVREDDIELFGFATEAELSTFRLLITVSGIGPRAALSILTLLTPEQFALAVCTEDRKTIAKANGIGPKTAARVVLELKDKLTKSGAADLPVGNGKGIAAAIPVAKGRFGEATDALLVLGYSRAEALSALQGIDVENTELEEIIRLCLKKLVR